MPRLIRCGLLGLFSIAAVAGLPLACQSGGVGDACTPEDEVNPQFSGFAMTEEYIESRSFQCATRICLVNHFQGRVTCPLGQPASAITDCWGPSGPDDDLCDKARGERCVEAAESSVACDPRDEAACAQISGACDATLHICLCGPNTTPPPGFHCSADGAAAPPRRFVCHRPGDCQLPGESPARNAGKACCVPGTDTPVATPVCGQCDRKSTRDAEQAVYCSCRCGIADGAPEEPNFNFCACPTGFTCSEIRPYLGSEQETTGKYCIKEGTAYDGELGACGLVTGNHEAPCLGLGL